MIAQLTALNNRRPLDEYCQQAARLLNPSLAVRNAPNVEAPFTCSVAFASRRFFDLELRGAAQVEHAGFVLVAGGLGERLGQSEIKVALETESTTHTSFLATVLQGLDVLQAKELCIMTSDDTHARTMALLATIPHRVAVSLVKQDRVPAICNKQGYIAKESTFRVLEKPHGHGDVHRLLLSSGTARRWLDDVGLRWLCLFQDSNPLAVRSLVMALGVSDETQASANVVAVPRLARSAAGMLCNVDGRTVNIEYNQIDGFLPHGDHNDAATGFSPFPGNTNQIVFDLQTYNGVLARTGGLVPEFVNPKFKPGSHEFAKPTRLECLMQDILLAWPVEAKTVVTLVTETGTTPIVPQAHPLYAPSKNDRQGAKRLRALGAADGSAVSSELSVYASTFTVLKAMGVCFPADCFTALHIEGTEFNVPPRIVLSPDVLPTWASASALFPEAAQVRIAKAACLIVRGPGAVVIHALDLDGMLCVNALHPRSRVVIKRAKVRNAGGFALVARPESVKGFGAHGDATMRVIEARDAETLVVDDV